MRDFRDAKAMAQSLREALKAKSVSLTYSESLELIARTLGVPDWNVLAARIQASRPGPPSSVTIAPPPAAHASNPPSKFTAWKPNSRSSTVASALRSPVRDIATSLRFIGKVKRCASSWSSGIDHESGACPAANSARWSSSMLASDCSPG